MSKVNTPIFEATGTLRIIDKHGNVKQELEITSVQLPEEQTDRPKEASKDED